MAEAAPATAAAAADTDSAQGAASAPAPPDADSPAAPPPPQQQPQQLQQGASDAPQGSVSSASPPPLAPGLPGVAPSATGSASAAAVAEPQAPSAAGGGSAVASRRGSARSLAASAVRAPSASAAPSQRSGASCAAPGRTQQPELEAGGPQPSAPRHSSAVGSRSGRSLRSSAPPAPSHCSAPPPAAASAPSVSSAGRHRRGAAHAGQAERGSVSARHSEPGPPPPAGPLPAARSFRSAPDGASVATPAPGAAAALTAAHARIAELEGLCQQLQAQLSGDRAAQQERHDQMLQALQQMHVEQRLWAQQQQSQLVPPAQYAAPLHPGYADHRSPSRSPPGMGPRGSPTGSPPSAGAPLPSAHFARSFLALSNAAAREFGDLLLEMRTQRPGLVREVRSAAASLTLEVLMLSAEEAARRWDFTEQCWAGLLRGRDAADVLAWLAPLRARCKGQQCGNGSPAGWPSAPCVQ
eukprot:TRINITY_DN35368_c0_g1_i4.p1 TRINITY_DN35368_c0_g1~~TRINITY_DN35368_c0_g1_i4.p1  ORF type:complete len:468 (+),score=99.50 TRINITY_DN35368_c0_g1_i4:70-1473(+)